MLTLRPKYKVLFNDELADDETYEYVNSHLGTVRIPRAKKERR